MNRDDWDNYGCLGMTGMTKDVWGLLGMSRDDLGD